MLPKQIDQILDLAQENLELARFERTLIVRMAHIYQRAHKPSDILTLIPKRAPKEFLTNIAPSFESQILLLPDKGTSADVSLDGGSDTSHRRISYQVAARDT
jgi:hypothetical protein